MATSRTQTMDAAPITDDTDYVHPRTVLSDIVTEYIVVDGDRWMDFDVYNEIAATSVNTVDRAGEVS